MISAKSALSVSEKAKDIRSQEDVILAFLSRLIIKEAAIAQTMLTITEKQYDRHPTEKPIVRSLFNNAEKYIEALNNRGFYTRPDCDPHLGQSIVIGWDTIKDASN